MTEPRVVLLFPGQGSQFPGMGTELYGKEEEFTTAIDELFAAMGDLGGRLRTDWLTDPALPIDDGPRSQPLLFAVDYAIGRALRARGLLPDVLVGHSIGELAAAALAGVFDLGAAARILVGRARALRSSPPGGLLAVAAPRHAAVACVDSAWESAGVVVGAVNGPSQTVLAGPEPELSLAEGTIRAAGLAARRVRATEPFHSPVLRPTALEWARTVAAEELRPPRVSVWSTRTGRPVTPQQATTPDFWAWQLAEPVLFWPTLSDLLDEGDVTLVEAGPGKALSMPARRHPSVREGRSRVISLLPSSGPKTWATWLAGIAALGLSPVTTA
ncbi:acyltransferase domain-containing protein [Streptomyces sp. NPDC005538]|uniref:acyltransferase domain-containing protein n=1 Tax=unclassified Streptomyces TaxID=2593676 RepID=UPI0033AF4211